jgi:hypothetical protein
VLTLPEVRAAQAYGEVRRLHGPEMATWRMRLLVEAGILRAVAVGAPAMPADAPGYVHQVYGSFLYLLGCKWLYRHGAPTAFSRGFASAWCGVGERQAGDAIQHLTAAGFMRCVGKVGRMPLYLPGGAGH